MIYYRPSGDKMEKLLCGKYERNVDFKGRVIIPKKLIEPDTEILYLKDTEYNFKIFELEQYKLIIEKYKEIYINTYDNQKKKSIDITLFDLLDQVIVPGSIDSLSRALLSMEIRKKYEIDKKTLLIGFYDHIKVFPNIENYKKYEEKIKTM